MPVFVDKSGVLVQGWAVFGCLLSVVLQVIGLIVVFLWVIELVS
jgi:hypothetical protein